MTAQAAATDLPTSAAWYRQLFSAAEHRNVDPHGTVRQVTLIEPNSGLELCLVSYPSHPADQVSEFRAGLDHLEFLVATREELDRWAAPLDQLGIAPAA